MRRRLPRRPTAYMVTVVVAVAVVVGVWLSGSATEGAASTAVPSRSMTSTPPPVLTARRLRPRLGARGLLRRGTAATELFGNRVFANARVGFALADGPNAQYPAVSIDGGRHWKIDGPQLHIDGADGPEAVEFVGVTGPRTFFAYGSSTVDVTTDGGRVWWETLLGEQVMAVVPSFDNALVAYVEQSVTRHLNPAVTWQYVSRDGGRHWRYSTAFGGVSG